MEKLLSILFSFFFLPQLKPQISFWRKMDMKFSMQWNRSYRKSWALNLPALQIHCWKMYHEITSFWIKSAFIFFFLIQFLFLFCWIFHRAFKRQGTFHLRNKWLDFNFCFTFKKQMQLFWEKKCVVQKTPKWKFNQ